MQGQFSRYLIRRTLIDSFEALTYVLMQSSPFCLSYAVVDDVLIECVDKTISGGDAAARPSPRSRVLQKLLALHEFAASILYVLAHCIEHFR